MTAAVSSLDPLRHGAAPRGARPALPREPRQVLDVAALIIGDPVRVEQDVQLSEPHGHMPLLDGVNLLVRAAQRPGRVVAIQSGRLTEPPQLLAQLGLVEGRVPLLRHHSCSPGYAAQSLHYCEAKDDLPDRV
ncbi:hypothetical protein GCM10018963_35550 [Saccharothrix longispora]